VHLNEEQEIIANVRDGAYTIVAGPGAGKSTTLVARHKRLIASGASMSDVLNLTFTKEAADNMMKKASASRDSFCTFHSLGYRICTIESGRQNVEPELRHRLLSKLCKTWGLDYKNLASYISRNRRNGISPAAALEDNSDWKYGYARAYQEYENERIRAGWADFDSMLAEAIALLRNAEIRAKYQYHFCQIDEAQDCEPCQYEMVKLLSEKHGNVLFVGDRAQAIYGFRDAVVDFEAAMKTIWPAAKTLYLGKNYRSHSKLVDFIKRKAPVLSPLTELMHSARLDSGLPIEYQKFDMEMQEVESTVHAAQEDPTNSAILARTNRGLALYENYCLTNNIRVHLLGKSGFWKSAAVLRAVEKLRTLSHLSLIVALNTAWPQLETHYREAEDRTAEDDYAWENLQTLKEIALSKFVSVNEFCGFANRCAHAKRAAKGITLSTVHQAKGGEWANVFLVGCKEGNLPHAKGDLAEERRVFYVAISRAKDRLKISFTGNPSMFIKLETNAQKS
jgi:DNA helicase-2/ATP-dependent DNA helicase PcrA